MTCDVNRFPPLRLMPFSLEVGGGSLGVGDCVVVVVVGDCVVDGAFEPLPPQPAIDATNPPRTATLAATRASRAASEFPIMTPRIDSTAAAARFCAGRQLALPDTDRAAA